MERGGLHQANLGVFPFPLFGEESESGGGGVSRHTPSGTGQPIRKSHPKMLSARKIVSGDMAVTLPPTKE